jgi:CHAT domain-containing protein/tetratricopeptide (TPR) repeat protein
MIPAMRQGSAFLAFFLFAGAAAAAAPLPLEKGCDLELAMESGGAPLLLAASEAAAAGWLQVEQLGIDVSLAAGERRADAPTGRWGFETWIFGGQRTLEIRAGEKLASPGRLRLRCAELPADGPAHAYLASLAAAGLLPSDERGDVRAALELYRRLAGEPAAAAPEWRLQSAWSAAYLMHRSDPAAAAALLAPALAAAGELESRPWLRAALELRQGLLERDLRRLEEAEAALRRSLDIWQRLGLRPQEATCRHNLGLIELQRGQPAAALENFRRALELQPPPLEPAWRGDFHGGAGGALDRLGRLRPALDEYRQALELVRQAGEPRTRVGLLSNLALCHLALGERQRALELLAEADQLLPAGDDAIRGTLRNNLGFAYLGLGDARAAAETFEAALVFRRKSGDRRGELISLNNLGSARRLLGRAAPAEEAHRQALAIAVELGDARQQGISRLRLAELALSRAEAAPVLAELELAAARAGQSDPRLYADILRTRGRALLLAGRLEEAAATAAAMLAASADSQDRLAQIEGDLLLAEIARQEERHDDALEAAGRAGQEALAQRERLVSAEHRARFLAAQRDAFALWIDSALALGRPELALEVAESSRNRTLLDVLGAARPLESLSLAAMKALLDEDTALLELVVGKRRSHAFLLTRGGLETAALPAETELDPLLLAAADEQNVARTGGGAATPAGDRLARLLLSPFAASLAARRRLVVVPDGRFAHLSFAALPDPAAAGGLLIDRFEIVYIPSLAVLAGQRRLAAERPPAPSRVAVFADPVFSAADPRVAPAPGAARAAENGDWGRLAASRHEAAAILELAGAGDRGRGSRGWLDFAASKAAFLDGELRGYRYLHLATHGEVDLDFGERTGLVFSAVDAKGNPRDGLLSLTQIYGLKLDADLVVLSACRSAVGEEIRGEGLISLSRAFLHAGVPKVAATLWRIPDVAASRLMPELYRGLWQRGETPAAALRRAQLALRAQRRFRHSFYWAGFVYIGDWRAAPETLGAAATVLPRNQDEELP